MDDPIRRALGYYSTRIPALRQALAKSDSFVLLVERESDRDYIEHLRKHHTLRFPLPPSLEVVVYNGKDALKNPALVKFVLSKVKKAFITFDVDVAEEIRKPLMAIGLIENQDFTPIGLSKPGMQCIEGLVPERVKNAVHARESDLVAQLGSNYPNERHNAKRALKKRYLDEFIKTADLSDSDLIHFTKLAQLISKRFGNERSPGH